MEQNLTIPGIKRRFADPTVDFAFKRIFGTERYKDATINLLNSLLPQCNIRNVTFLNTELAGETSDSRKCCIDVLCEDDKGAHFVVEMQKADQVHFRERTVFYSSKVVSMLPPQGQGWDYSLPPSYVIAFINFKMNAMLFDSRVPDDEYMLHYVSTERKYGHSLPGAPEYIFLGIKNFNKSERELATYPEKWLYLFANTEPLEDIPELFAEDTVFSAYFAACERAGFSKEEEERYTTDMMNDWDIANSKREACDRAREEGLKEGKREIARAMLSGNVDLAAITKFTGLSEQEIRNL